MKKASLLLAIFALFGITSCATVGGVRDVPLDEGVSRVFQADIARVVQAARESILEAGLRMEEVNELDGNGWMFIATRDMTEWSWGEIVRVVISGTSATETTVWVVSERKSATNFTAEDFTTAILTNIHSKVATKALTTAR
jgi:hypothetical protein